MLSSLFFGAYLAPKNKLVEHPNYEPIRAPILAIYAVPKTPVHLVPRYKTGDRERRRAFDKIFEIWRLSAKTQRDRFRKSVPQARVVEIDGASHYLFISHREKVLQEVSAFLRTR